jgi:hypothetical protein
MSEFSPQELSSEELEQIAKNEASLKIRRFIDDPHLKFHFSRTENLPNILEKGILSQAFANRIGQGLSEDFGYIDAEKQYRSISIADRDKNNFEGDPKNIDWWIKRFADNSDDYNYGGAGYIGFLLPSNLKVRDYEIQPHESHVPIRISPNQIDGLFAIKKDELFGRVSSYPQGEDGEEYQKRSEQNFTPKDLVGHFHIGGFDSIGDVKGAARILNLPEGFVRPIDILIYFAKKNHIPLYLVNKEFTDQKVVWPTEEQRKITFSQARNFRELYSLIDYRGGVQGSQEFYEPQVLKGLIEKVKNGQMSIKHITRTDGLRDQVEELIYRNQLL